MIRRNFINSIIGFSGTFYIYSKLSQPALASNIDLNDSITIPENNDSPNVILSINNFIVKAENIDTDKSININIDLKLDNNTDEILSTTENISEGNNNINIDDLNILTNTFDNKLNDVEKNDFFEIELIVSISHDDLNSDTVLNKKLTVNIAESKIPEIDNYDEYSIGEFPSSYIIEDSTVSDYMFVDDTRSLSEGQSLRFGDTGGGNYNFGEIDNGFKTFMSADYDAIKPNTLTMSYNETSDSNGQWVRWMDGDKELLSVGTTNGELEIVTGNGTERLANNDSLSPTYDKWRTYTITIDWENKTFDLLWEDITGNTNNIERNNLTFRDDNINDVTRLEFGRDQRVNDNGSGQMDCWYDNISFKPD